MGKRSLGSEFQGVFRISGSGETHGQAETQLGGVPDSDAAYYLAGMVALGRIDAYWKTNDRLVASVESEFRATRI
jgi:hypothetical protein